MNRFQLLAVALTISVSAFGQKVSLTDFIAETQKWEKNGAAMKLAWWLPTDYWRIALGENPNIPAGAIDQIENLMDQYVLIFAANVTIHSDGSVTGDDAVTLGKGLSITDGNNKKYSPLKREEVDSQVLQIEDNITPMLEQSMGAMGKSMHLFFFRIKDANQKNVLDVKKPGSFTVVHSESSFKWSLPLPIFMPEKKCPKDNATMRGDWLFCPYHGIKLN